MALPVFASRLVTPANEPNKFRAVALVASLGYAFQLSINTRGVNSGWIFHGLAITGAAFFVGACAVVIRRRVKGAARE